MPPLAAGQLFFPSDLWVSEYYFCFMLILLPFASILCCRASLFESLFIQLLLWLVESQGSLETLFAVNTSLRLGIISSQLEKQ